MKGHKKAGIIRYLLYLVLVTSVITSVSLAKYASTGEGRAAGLVASFTTGTTLDLEMPVLDMLYPGSKKEIAFVVTNFQGEQNSEVPLEYEMQVETTGNLPLKFSLAGTKEEGASDTLVGPLDNNLRAVGGHFPSAGLEGKKTHTYTLTVEWPLEQSDGINPTDPGYSDEIDQVTVRIKTAQAAF